jgi:hypothetical protein
LSPAQLCVAPIKVAIAVTIYATSSPAQLCVATINVAIPVTIYAVTIVPIPIVPAK